MNNYHIYQQQAKGKYSVIFKARKKKRLEFVAIKRLQKTRKSKIYNEAKILSQLSHPSIIKFYDFMQTKNHMWQITEYCPGGDLLRLIEYDKMLPEQTVKSFALEIMAGMQYAHSKGVVICDIKPASILINQYGNVKIGDFGSAQKLVDLMGNSKMKKKGTPSYMAPELFQVGGVYSFQSDFWALGCILYELSQGNPPFVSTNFQQIAELSKQAPTPKVQSFSSDFSNLLQKLLEKSPFKRITWQGLINHPWIDGKLPDLDIPAQNHFIEYEQNLSKKSNMSEKLRVSQNFENYDKGSVLANDKRQQFEFDNYNEEYQQQLEQPAQNYAEEDLSIFNKGMMQQQVNMSKKTGPSIVQVKPKIFNQHQQRLQDSTTINQFIDTPLTKPTTSLEDAINHQSDAAVKPIIGNKDIELIESFTFNKKQLGFNYIEPQALAEGILNGQMVEQLTAILEGMKGDQKQNVLGYFQTIVQNSQVANYLFKPQFVPYYMGLIKSYKQSSLRAKICEILGFLIRHATSIQSEILKHNIIQGFLQAITKDKSEKVRRKAMAALGQLLFYGATQVDEDALQWDLSLSLISSLLKILKNTAQDEIVRIYCCKSIQNITAQAQKVGLNFSQIDTLIVMINCFATTKNEGFKTSIMCSIHHMISLNPTLREIFLEKAPLNSIIQTLQEPDASSKTIQIILWIFLQQFFKNIKSKYSKQLIQNKQFTKTILSILDNNKLNSSSIVKGRVYLYIYYLLTYDFKKLSIIADSKLFTFIQRNGKQSGKYQSEALKFLLSFLNENFSKIIKYTNEQIQLVVGNKQRTIEKNNYLLIIYQMQNCSVFEELFSSFQNIQLLLIFFNLIEANLEIPYIEHFKNHYFVVMEKIFMNTSTTEKLQSEYISVVIPFLIGKILKTPKHDIRFACIKYLTALINYILSQEFLYDSKILSQTTTKLSQMIQEHLITQLDYLFSKGERTEEKEGEEDIVSSMIFRLTAQLFKGRQQFVEKYWKTCKIENILKFYNQTSSAHILKTVQLLLQLGRKQTIGIKKLDLILQKTVTMLSTYTNQGNELFFQYPLSILFSLLKKYQLTLSKPQTDAIFQATVQLQGHEDKQVRQKAQLLIQTCLSKEIYSNQGLDNWKNLGKKGQQNYQKYSKLAGIKPNDKNDRRQNRYS